MAVPKKKTPKSKRNKRRSHHALKSSNLVKCKNCKVLITPHKVCPECGFYKGRQILDTRPKKEKKKEKQKATEKRRTRKEKKSKT